MLLFKPTTTSRHCSLTRHSVLLSLTDLTFCAVLIPSDYLKQILPLTFISPLFDPNTLLVKRSFRLSSKCWKHLLIFPSSILRRMSFVHQLLNVHSVKTDFCANILCATLFSNFDNVFLLLHSTRTLIHGIFF